MVKHGFDLALRNYYIANAFNTKILSGTYLAGKKYVRKFKKIWISATASTMGSNFS